MTTHVTPHISGCRANQYAAIGARLNTDLLTTARRDLIQSMRGSREIPDTTGASNECQFADTIAVNRRECQLGDSL